MRNVLWISLLIFLIPAESRANAVDDIFDSVADWWSSESRPTCAEGYRVAYPSSSRPGKERDAKYECVPADYSTNTKTRDTFSL